MEMCDCLQELIDNNNLHVEMTYELIEVLLKTYLNVEETLVNDVVCEMMDGLAVNSANVCAIANCVDKEHDWFMDEELFILRDDELEDDCDCECENCECDFGPKISDYLS